MITSAQMAVTFTSVKAAFAGALLALLAFEMAAAAGDFDGHPMRVVSINLCTDQMAMLLAKDGQLVSVSALSADPMISAMASEAERFRLNHGLAEDVFLMRPDLVLAGSYTARETVNLLKRLGIPVSEFSPETSLKDVRDNLLRMGTLLGTEGVASTMVAQMDREIADLVANTPSLKTAALYYANGYTSGDSTLAGDIVATAGLENIGASAGVDGLGRLPLERLIMTAPQVIIGGESGYTTPALAQAVFAHPAFAVARQRAEYVTLASKYTICGGPFNITAITLLREKLSEARGEADE